MTCACRWCGLDRKTGNWCAPRSNSAVFSNNMTRVVITGAKGRMGQALIQCAARFPDLQITGKVDLGDDIKTVIDNSDVVIDFSFHNATAAIAQLCVARGKALVIGTTGHSDAERAEIMTLV